MLELTGGGYENSYMPRRGVDKKSISRLSMMMGKQHNLRKILVKIRVLSRVYK